MAEPQPSTSALDPLLALMATNPPKSPQDFRRILDEFALAGNGTPPEIGENIDDVTLFTVDGVDVKADIHRPQGAGPFPVLLYLHGGGWIMGTPKTHRRLAIRFAEAGFLVVNLGYRLAPEHPFPAGFEDCVRAARWAIANAAKYGGDASRFAIGGDSAGGNLTAAIAAELADDARARPKCVLLIYPVLDFANMQSGPDLPNGANLMEFMAGSYIGQNRAQLTKDWRVSPMHVAEKLPPAHILCGTADSLLLDANQLAERLKKAGKPHELQIYDGMPHGFVQMEEMFPAARASIDRMIAFLRAHL